MFRAYIDMFINFADFSTRTSRRDYWLAFLASCLIITVLAFISPSFVYVYLLIVVIPDAAIKVRRLHDIGVSGWWYLLLFIPIGVLILNVMLLFVSDGDNEYGPKPNN